MTIELARPVGVRADDPGEAMMGTADGPGGWHRTIGLGVMSATISP
jgi:hypothetical protein